MQTIKYLACVCMLSGLVSCKAVNPFTPSHGGNTSQELRAHAALQTSALATIDTAATEIYSKVEQEPLKKAAKTILDESDKLKPIITVLQKETGAQAEYERLYGAYTQLEAKHKSGFIRMMLFLRVIGILAIPAGLLLAKLISRDLLLVSVGGVILMLSTQLDQFIERYGAWMVGAIVAVISVVMLRMYLVQRKSVMGATRVGEALKEIVKQENPAVIKDLFGDGTIPGKISHDPATERIITAARREILHKSKPVSEQV
jgi:hypothetical protein